MKDFWEENTVGTFDVRVGSNITDTIIQAIAFSAALDFLVKFEFNGVTVIVRSDSDPDLIYRDWFRSLSGYIGESVGPNPNPILTDEEKASDAFIEVKSNQANKERQAEYEAEAKTYREAVEAKLVNAPSIELADEAGLEEVQDRQQ